MICKFPAVPSPRAESRAPARRTRFAHWCRSVIRLPMQSGRCDKRSTKVEEAWALRNSSAAHWARSEDNPLLAARRTVTFTESVIREMTRIATMHQAVNLAQGFPDFPMPEPMKEAACAAIRGDINQYAVTWGTPVLRQAIAEKYRRWYKMEVDPDRDVTVTCGATEAMASVFMALMNPGDEVIVPEPFYENYGPDAILAGAKPVFVPLTRPDWQLDVDRLRATFN